LVVGRIGAKVLFGLATVFEIPSPGVADDEPAEGLAVAGRLADVLDALTVVLVGAAFGAGFESTSFAAVLLTVEAAAGLTALLVG
jgi:hypothetical protein